MCLKPDILVGLLANRHAIGFMKLPFESAVGVHLWRCDDDLAN